SLSVRRTTAVGSTRLLVRRSIRTAQQLWSRCISWPSKESVKSEIPFKELRLPLIVVRPPDQQSR
ncbi:hypothetical protein ACLOJK_009350, partial [Asimina triloba]